MSRTMTPIRDILRAAAKAWGIEPAARLAQAQEAWPRVAGTALAESSAPVALRGGRLLVGVTHAAAGQEVRLRRAGLLRGLAAALAEDAITEIVPVSRRRLPGRGARTTPGDGRTPGDRKSPGGRRGG